MITTTDDLYCLLETAANDLGQTTYDAQRAAYLTTHPSAKRFRYTPTADHRFLIVLLGTSHLDACSLHDLITSYQAYVLMRGAPPYTVRIFQALAEALAAPVDRAVSA